MGLIGCGLGCGGTADLDFAISLGGLIGSVTQVEVFLFEGRTTCEAVNAMSPRGTQALYGPYVLPVDAGTRSSGALLSRSDLRSASYLVWADARDVNGLLVGTGCTPGQRIEDQRISRIDVFLTPTP